MIAKKFKTLPRHLLNFPGYQIIYTSIKRGRCEVLSLAFSLSGQCTFYVSDIFKNKQFFSSKQIRKTKKTFLFADKQEKFKRERKLQNVCLKI